MDKEQIELLKKAVQILTQAHSYSRDDANWGLLNDLMEPIIQVIEDNGG